VTGRVIGIVTGRLSGRVSGLSLPAQFDSVQRNIF
jgi:hypothetical protein